MQSALRHAINTDLENRNIHLISKSTGVSYAVLHSWLKIPEKQINLPTAERLGAYYGLRTVPRWGCSSPWDDSAEVTFNSSDKLLKPKHRKFLNRLRREGTDMYSAVPSIEEEFDISVHDASEILYAWMRGSTIAVR